MSLALALALNAAIPASPVISPAVEAVQGQSPSGAEAPAVPTSTAVGPVAAAAADRPSPEPDAPASTPVTESVTTPSPPVPAEPVPQQPAAPAAPAPGGSDIVVTARPDIPGDPLATVNAESFEVIQAVDKAVIGPVAMGYKTVVPDPLRMGLRNFLRNLEEPVIALNYLLQLKPGRAVKSLGRLAINSTMGIGGLVDVAKRKPFDLPYTPNGFANTFACWGIGPGPYFFLPLVGPTTLRDVIGVSLDRVALPLAVGKPLNRPAYAIPANVIDSLNDRIEIDDQLDRIRRDSGDPYSATRDLYLKQRKSEIAAICPKKGETVDKTLPPRPGKGRD